MIPIFPNSRRLQYSRVIGSIVVELDCICGCVFVCVTIMCLQVVRKTAGVFRKSDTWYSFGSI